MAVQREDTHLVVYTQHEQSTVARLTFKDSQKSGTNEQQNPFPSTRPAAGMIKKTKEGKKKKSFKTPGI